MQCDAVGIVRPGHDIGAWHTFGAWIRELAVDAEWQDDLIDPHREQSRHCQELWG